MFTMLTLIKSLKRLAKKNRKTGQTEKGHGSGYTPSHVEGPINGLGNVGAPVRRYEGGRLALRLLGNVTFGAALAFIFVQSGVATTVAASFLSAGRAALSPVLVVSDDVPSGQLSFGVRVREDCHRAQGAAVAEVCGLVVTRVYEGSPAAAASMQVGDTITEVGELPATKLKDTQSRLMTMQPMGGGDGGGVVTSVRLCRAGTCRSLEVTP